MYAIIKSGGKQYRVEQDTTVDVELLNVEQGSEVEFQEVLFFFDGSAAKIGQPSLGEIIVIGEVIATVAGDKINAIKYKPSHNQYRRFGHRQHYSRVKIKFMGSRKDKKEKGDKHGT